MKAIHAFPRAARILRSVMIAGAGAAAWVALSTTAANADTGSTGSLLGELKSSVSSTVSSTSVSVSDQLGETLSAATGAVKNTAGAVSGVVSPKPTAPTISVPVPDLPLPAAIKLAVPSQINVPVPAVTPVVEQVVASTDDVVSTVPVVNEIVPAGTLGTVVDSAVTPVTGTVDDAAGALVPPVNDVVKPIGLTPVTDVATPVVKPIVDAVDSVLPPLDGVVPPIDGVIPPVTGPGAVLPPLGGTDDSTPSSTPTLPDGHAAVPSAVVLPAVPETSTATVLQAGDSGRSNAGLLAGTTAVTGHQRVPLFVSWNHGAASGGESATAPVAVDGEAPGGIPADPESAPVSGATAGSGSSHSGPPSQAAAVLAGGLIIPANLISGLASAGTHQHPKPVSFDPGSSPD
jgi:hypothetical protein